MTARDIRVKILTRSARGGGIDVRNSLTKEVGTQGEQTFMPNLQPLTRQGNSYGPSRTTKKSRSDKLLILRERTSGGIREVNYGGPSHKSTRFIINPVVHSPLKEGI